MHAILRFSFKSILLDRLTDPGRRIDAAMRGTTSLLISFIKLLRTLTFSFEAIERESDVFWPFAGRGVLRSGDNVILYLLPVGVNEFVCGLNDRPKL